MHGRRAKMESGPNWFYSLPPGFGMIITADKQYNGLPGGLQEGTRVSMKLIAGSLGDGLDQPLIL